MNENSVYLFNLYKYLVGKSMSYPKIGILDAQHILANPAQAEVQIDFVSKAYAESVYEPQTDPAALVDEDGKKLLPD
jgi:hypothetical protein